MTVARDSSEKEFKVIGTRPIRHDGVDKVTGRALYGADSMPTGTLHGKVLRSPHAHAMIRSIDASRALELPGVKAVVTAADFPEIVSTVAHLGEGPINLRDLRDNLMATGKVLYRGHAIAAVAATSTHIARAALELIDVEYEVLPPILDVCAAMEPGAPLLHDDLLTDDLGETASSPSNIARHVIFEKGNVGRGFKSAAKVFERTYDTTMVHQGYIEPQNATALWNADGTLTIWCSTQGAFSVRQQVAEVLRLPVSRIKVVPMEIGGGFGGKICIYLEPVAVLLSKKTGRPVKMTMERHEVFEGTGPTSGSHIEIKMGATRKGRIVAAEARLVYEAGAFPGSPFTCGMLTLFAPYDIDNILVEGYDVVVNKPKTSAYRAPGATNAAMASESILDEIAEWAAIDPLELRAMNAARKGTRRADGLKYPRIGYEETVEAARQHPHYATALSGPHRGRGVASGYWFNCGMRSSVTVTVNSDGTVSLIEGSTDIGGTRTSLAMQLAEVLGLDAEDIVPHVADTDSVGYNDITGGSRTTFASGLAVIEAGKELLKKMATRAAVLWEVSPEDVVVEGDIYRLKDDCDTHLTFGELAGKLNETGGPLVAQGSVDAEAATGGGFGTHIVDIEVDPDTGKVTILRYTAVQDVGRAIHPAYVEGQIQGGVVQGIGWALNEEYFYDESGRMANASFLDYRMPTALDVPMIEPVIVEVPNPGHPFGVRGAGEVPIVPPPAAIASAIYQATGVRHYRLPMTPARVLRGLLEKKGMLPTRGL